jgi:glutaryl-CoA dehydrogenase
VLNGAKRWIGNATFADVVVIWARDVDDDQVKGFLVEKGTPGFKATKMTHKIALRAVQNADIELTDVQVAESSRLQNANTFLDTATVLTASRAAVAWEAVGCARGAYEIALRYAMERKQFGRPIAKFQLVQDLLARMLGNIVASQCMALRVSQLADAGQAGVQHASLAKAFCTARMRETTGWARELLAGNGILLEYDVARFVADSEAIYSYEGTREINSLIVGLSLTGESAFVGK